MVFLAACTPNKNTMRTGSGRCQSRVIRESSPLLDTLDSSSLHVKMAQSLFEVGGIRLRLGSHCGFGAVFDGIVRAVEWPEDPLVVKQERVRGVASRADFPLVVVFGRHQIRQIRN